jgi:hypothetical protein
VSSFCFYFFSFTRPLRFVFMLFLFLVPFNALCTYEVGVDADSTVMGIDAVPTGKQVATFRRQIVPSYSGTRSLQAHCSTSQN